MHLVNFFQLIGLVIILGLVCYLINAVLPLPQWAKVTINVLFAIFGVILVFQFLGAPILVLR